ncbi:hypothetical protein ACFLW0_06145 [Chloroflexota bacterium]
MFIPDFLARYYQKGEYPFLSLNDLSLEEANKVKASHCIKNGIRYFYAQDDYLIHRKEIERWIYRELIRLGGKPANEVPVYMTLGESPDGEYDIRADIQKDAEEIRIPIREIDLSVVTFTYPDSMYELTEDADGNIIGGRRTNTPEVYLYRDLPAVIQKYGIYEDYKFNIEAQVWNREMLHRHWIKNIKGETQ